VCRQQNSNNLNLDTNAVSANTAFNVFNDPNIVVARRDAILTKMAKEIAYMDLSKGKTDATIRKDVQKQAGAFLYNVQQQYVQAMETEQKANRNGSKNVPVTDIKYEYYLLNAEAKKMGVDVYDTTVARANKNSFLDGIRKSLTSGSYTPDQVKTLLDQIGNIYDVDVKDSQVSS
jgi:hypothetical protein